MHSTSPASCGDIADQASTASSVCTLALMQESKLPQTDRIHACKSYQTEAKAGLQHDLHLHQHLLLPSSRLLSLRTDVHTLPSSLLPTPPSDTVKKLGQTYAQKLRASQRCRATKHSLTPGSTGACAQTQTQQNPARVAQHRGKGRIDTT